MVGLLTELVMLIPRWLKIVTVVLLALFSVVALTPYAAVAIAGVNAGAHINSTEPSLIDKSRAMRELVRYAFRELVYSPSDATVSPVSRQRGRFIGVDKSGLIHLELYTDKGRVRQSGKIADLDFNHPREIHFFIQQQVDNKFVIVDTYHYLGEVHYVVWLHDGTPVNETLILANLARPTATPPTNIVNTMFRSHYLQILKR